MTPQTSTREKSEAIGKLCIGGEWACAHGDFGGLRYVAKQLADVAPRRLQRELVELVSACGADPDRASTLWNHVKGRLHRSSR